jgi:hypothetical protein
LNAAEYVPALSAPAHKIIKLLIFHNESKELSRTNIHKREFIARFAINIHPFAASRWVFSNA